MTEIVDEATVTSAAGHAFPGGQYAIEHWENFLLTACTGAELMADGIVHPISLGKADCYGGRS